MLGWAHYRFQQRLIAKAEELGVPAIIQNEAYMQLVWKHPKHRIQNGARGIFLRALLDGALILSGDHEGNSSIIYY
ncbi:hypothetical protein G9A89_002012 [Geosiphon pyriformis]|nr:hypothetical protein G9A89_004706 [Geosiphon pyriformis]KAG9297323.1 hypothetical protein G9A89_002012 [Geosiphon pyriformis]